MRMTGGRDGSLQEVDLESVGAEISAARLTAQANRVKIAESREVLERAAETIERLQQGQSTSTPGTQALLITDLP